MRIWVKQFRDNHLLKDITIEDYSNDTRTHKVFAALENACKEFDLSVPVWLELNIQEFKRHRKTRFTKDCFVEEIDFDYLEFHVIEE